MGPVRYHSWIGLSACALAACGRVGFDPSTGSVGGDGGDGSDGGGSNAADARPQPLCATKYSGALFCDDFEAPDLSRWTVDINGTNSVVRDTFARSGTGAAHAIHAESGTSQLIVGALGGATSGTLYARFYQWMPSSSVIEGTSILHLVDAITPFPGIVIVVNATDMFVQSTISTTQGPNADITLRRDAWVCVQASVAIGPTGSVVTLIDGVLGPSYAGDTETPNGYVDVHVGIFSLQAPTLEVWVDDVVVDTAPIPCD